MIILSKMNKKNRIGYIRKAMNLLKLKRILMAACMLLSLGLGMSSCTLETSDNGYFDGYWHLERVDTLADRKSVGRERVC